ncbi:MAG: ribonuclease III [Candidatus Pacebacteria bacterium]|nr:ribonuclease III [Candidatus Paceibacterota bacterium]
MEKIESLEKKIGIRFKNKTLLEEALIHRSYLNESPKQKLNSNERLEFLGDSILEFVSSLFLFKRLPSYSEGKLTNIRSWLVRTSTLATLAEDLNLGDLLLLSRGEEELGGRKNPTLLANCFESLIGAMFLDQGLEPVEKFLLIVLQPKLEEIIKSQRFKDFKSLFQELIQAKEKITPQYTVLDEQGPDHDKIFTVGLWAGEKLWAKGKGKSKLEAEEKAAAKALKKAKEENG